jgi:hypothetical protein
MSRLTNHGYGFEHDVPCGIKYLKEIGGKRYFACILCDRRQGYAPEESVNGITVGEAAVVGWHLVQAGVMSKYGDSSGTCANPKEIAGYLCPFCLPLVLKSTQKNRGIFIRLCLWIIRKLSNGNKESA